MFWVRFLVLALLSLAGVTQTSSSPTQASEPPNPTEEQPPLNTGSLSFPWSRLRLPGYIVPLHYHPLLHPNLTILRYSGTVRIEFQVQNNTNWVVLHSKGLRITMATVLPVLHNPTHEQVAIFSPRVLSGGQKTLASTHFEPTSARMAFPCFDEPSFKANYSISIKRSPAHTALSNMPVVNLVAIPDFQSGAMEDWGLITFRETSLLYDPATSSASDRLWVTMVIAHELAHQSVSQWFGNLVTMEWWNDIWLNEGFARYMEYISVDATYPELRVGAYVLHMLRHYLTDQVFQSGIMRYLRRYSYSNACNQELWDSLANMCSEEEFTSGEHCYSSSQAAKNAYLYAGEHLDLTTMMNTWTLQTGVPLVNVDMAGYYLVHYDGSGWDDLIQLLKNNHTALSFMDRTHLIHNAFQLTTAGRLSLDKALDLIGYLRSESHTVPLLQGLAYLEAFYRMVERMDIPDVTQNLRTYILWYFRGVIDRQMWSDKGSVSERRQSSELLSLACHLGDLPCLEQAQRSFTHWLDSNSTLSLPAVTETVYSVGAQEDSGWASLLHIYTLSLSETHKHKILSALASSRDTNKLHKLLELGLEGKVIRTQDLASLLVMVARNPRGHHLAWTYVQKYWSTLVDKFQLGSFSIRNIIIGTTGQFSSTEELTEVRVFFESIHEQASQLRVTQVAIDNIQKNILWIERNLGTLRSWLNQRIDSREKGGGRERGVGR
ncbi:unnamed protein product [Coregonus sp. 'balchen']|nr:unnamed protein product [Coregonus sp. 'balchen']